MGAPFSPEAIEIARRILPAASPVGVLRELLEAIDADILARAALSAAVGEPVARQAAEAAAYGAAERLDWARAAAEIVITLTHGEATR